MEETVGKALIVEGNGRLVESDKEGVLLRTAEQLAVAEAQRIAGTSVETAEKLAIERAAAARAAEEIAYVKAAERVASSDTEAERVATAEVERIAAAEAERQGQPGQKYDYTRKGKR